MVKKASVGECGAQFTPQQNSPTSGGLELQRCPGQGWDQRAVNMYSTLAAATADKPASLTNAGEGPDGKGEEQEEKRGGGGGGAGRLWG